ncbi:MAG: hypothetical protein EOO78_22045, partial [Oxalobacteraceae bacterium]
MRQRKSALAATLIVAGGICRIGSTAGSAPAPRRCRPTFSSFGSLCMTTMTTNYVTTADGVRIFYKDWGHGTPIV